MKSNRLPDKEHELVELIRTVPLKPVPDDLSRQIMQRVSGRKASMAVRLRDFFLRPRLLMMRPVYGVGVALVVLASFYLGKHWQPQTIPSSESHVSESVRGPEYLDNPALAYGIGRVLLQSEGHGAEALPFLKRASQIEPQNPKFAYWEGLAYSSNGSNEQERDSYVRGLEADPGNVSLLVNLGHSYLEDRFFEEALDAYHRVLRLSPTHPAAIYNSGLIYRKRGLTNEEILSWRRYLAENRIGDKAFRAVDRLNGYGDYTFRVYRIGHRKVIVDHRALLDSSLPDWRRGQELSDIAAILEMNPRLDLEIIVFDGDDLQGARKKALDLKRLIADTGGPAVRRQLNISWFGQPEKIRNSDGTIEDELSEAIRIFSRLRADNQEEITI